MDHLVRQEGSLSPSISGHLQYHSVLRPRATPTKIAAFYSLNYIPFTRFPFRCQRRNLRPAPATLKTCASWPPSGRLKNFGVCIRICCAQMSCRRIPIITCSERVTAPSLPPKLDPALPYCICNDLFELSPIPYSFFSSGYLPMWESFPSGGCWIIRVRFLPLSTSPVLQHLCCFFSLWPLWISNLMLRLFSLFQLELLVSTRACGTVASICT